MYIREINDILQERLKEPRRFIQALLGPRQVGKTTSVLQVIESFGFPFHYQSADFPSIKDYRWIEDQWNLARQKEKSNGSAILILDEVHKIPKWDEVVKKLWDEDSRWGKNIKVVTLGSSPLLMDSGLSESLAGRFETIHATHWTYKEMKEAFGWDLGTYIYHGGYPGAAPLINDIERWKQYIAESIIEPTISRDISLTTRIDKPILLRRLFDLGCNYSGQILTYQKMLGQLTDKGNATTLAHYLVLLGKVGLIRGLEKYSGSVVRQRGSSPKLQVMNNALMSASNNYNYQQAKNNSQYWGRIVESSVGAHLVNSSLKERFRVFYWRASDREVDFVILKNTQILAIEVKSGIKKESLPGMVAFEKAYETKAANIQRLTVGSGGVPIEDFLSASPLSFLNEQNGSTLAPGQK